jgi:multiple sugar transport system permease protein
MKTRKFNYKTVIVMFIILVLLIWTLFPIYYLFITSVKPTRELFQTPPKLITRPTLATYHDILIENKFYRFFVNSFIIASASTILALAVGALAAFAFSQWRFRGQKLVFFMSLIGRMFPPFTTLIPIYLMVKFAQLMDTRISLILIYMAFLLPLILLILREFFAGVPVELCESARMDGCNNFQIFSLIVVPLSINGIVAAGVLAFVNAWNEFLFALVLTSFRAKTAPVALATFVEGEGMVQWGQLGVLGMCTILPTILFMAFMQRFLVKGLTLGALKG